MNAAMPRTDNRADREAALHRYAVAHDRFAEAELLLAGRGCPLVATLAHGYALITLRAYRAELDDPEPRA